MADIAVRPDELVRTAGELARAAERLGGVSRSLARADGGDVGSPGLADALDDFADDWRHGLGLLGQAADVTAAQLREAARAYADVDRVIAQACS